MKYMLTLILGIISLLYMDYLYNKELNNAYEMNKWVIRNYCRPNVIK